MEPTLIGYFPKQAVARPAWLDAPAVREVCSVSHCISRGPDNWILQWRHNEMWLYDTEDIARRVVQDAIQIEVLKDDKKDPPWHVELSRERADQFTFFAYRLFPVQFAKGNEEPFALPKLTVSALSDAYERLGCDAVSRSLGNSFECSPLSCNGLAKTLPVNRYCLIDDAESALQIAREFGRSNPEPGPYFVVEVWRRSGTAEASGAGAEERFSWSPRQINALVAKELNASNAFRPDQPIDHQWRLTACHGFCKPIRSASLKS